MIHSHVRRSVDVVVELTTPRPYVEEAICTGLCVGRDWKGCWRRGGGFWKLCDLDIGFLVRTTMLSEIQGREPPCWMPREHVVLLDTLSRREILTGYRERIPKEPTSFIQS